MNSVRKLKSVHFALTVWIGLCLSAAGCRNDFDFRREHDKAHDIYMRSSAENARAELEAFLHRAERNESLARKERNLDYDRALSMSWLQLAFVLEAFGELKESEAAIGKAITYFNRVDQIANDPEYQKDRVAWVRNLLIQVEKAGAPEWRKKPPADQKLSGSS